MSAISHIVVVVGSHFQICKKIIRQGIRKIAAVELQSKKLSPIRYTFLTF